MLHMCIFYGGDHLGLHNHLGCSSLEKINFPLSSFSLLVGLCLGVGSHVIVPIRVGHVKSLVLSLFWSCLGSHIVEIS